MKDLDYKRELIAYCKQDLKNRMADLQKEMDEAQKMANDYGAPKDRYDGFRAQMMRKKDMFAKQLQKAAEQWESLDMISLEKPSDKVDFGALVQTSMQNLFISISLGKIEFKGDTIYAISPHVPIFQAIKNLKASEKTLFNGNNIEIKSIV